LPYEPNWVEASEWAGAFVPSTECSTTSAERGISPPGERTFQGKRPMQNNVMIAASAAVVGLVFLVLAGVYWTHAAGSLPSFLPGYAAGSTHMHFKHGLGSLILALGLFAFAWFQSGRKSS
jgi:hypothetical protein